MFAHYRMARLLYLRQTKAKHLASIFDFALREKSRERFLGAEQRAETTEQRERLERHNIVHYELFNDEHGAEGYYDYASNEILIPALFDEALIFEFEAGVARAEVRVAERRFVIDKCGTIVETIESEGDDWE